MDVKETAKSIAKSIIKNYIDAKLGKVKKVAILIAGVGLGGIIMLSSIGGSGEAYQRQEVENLSGMNGASSALYSGTISINETKLSREEFIECVENYKDSDSYKTKFSQYAGMIYDVCTSKNINPELCVAQAKNESNFGEKVPTNSPWNYWGIAVYNDTNTGKEFENFEDAVTGYCDLILGYQQGSNAVAKEKAQQYSQYNDKITGDMNTIYDIFCAYAYLGDYHNGRIWDGVNAKKYLVDYMHFNCMHSESEETTMEERAAYAVDYVDNHIIKVATEIFGDGIIQVGDRIKVTITGEIGGEFTKVEPGYTDNNGDGTKDAGKYKFHSNITGLEHWGIYAQKYFKYRYNGTVYSWDGKCNRGAEFIILSGYTSNPFTDTFVESIRGNWDNERFNKYGLEIVKHQKNDKNPENGNNLIYKYVAEVQSAVPNGGYVALYIRNTEYDKHVDEVGVSKAQSAEYKDMRTGIKTPNIIGERWTRMFHWISIIGYEQKEGKEYVFVAETANGCTGWYPIEEFENMERGYITQIVTIMPNEGK